MQHMERRVAMKSNVLMTLLLSIAATPVMADSVLDSMFIGPAFQVTQISPDERRMMRERWEQASPEERTMMRRQFQERMQHPSPEERWSGAAPEQRRHMRDQAGQWMGRMATPPSPSDIAGMAGNFVGSFGTGFEQRRPNPTNPDDNATNPDSRNSFVPPAGWHRR
jgi:hypothetical protein